MKKYIFIVISFILICWPIRVFASDLELNTDVLKNKSEAHSSITDLYKIPIFSDKYKESIEEKNKKEIYKKEELLNNLFFDTFQESKNKQLRHREKESLFKQENSIVNSIVKHEKKEYPLTILIVVSIVSAGLIIVFTNRFYKNRRCKEDNYVHYNNGN